MKIPLWIPAGLVLLSIASAGTARTSPPEPAPPTPANAPPVADSSFPGPGGERVLRQSIVVDAPRDLVWKTMSTNDGLRTWLSPNVFLELKTGGRYDSNYRPGGAVTDADAIHNTVLCFVPLEMLSIRIGLTKNFPEGPRAAGTLFAILNLEDARSGRTRMIETMAGFGTGADWDRVYAFFERGNAYELRLLEKRFREGPIDWTARAAKSQTPPSSPNRNP